jgi:ketosteroid isomerase-like protein
MRHLSVHLTVIESCLAQHREGNLQDIELRALCHQFFDALEKRDVDTIDSLYADDMEFWINITGEAKPRDKSLAATRDGYARHRRRTYNDRRVNTFDCGFIAQYSLNIVRHDGQESSFWACVIAQCRNGKITRMEEYIDSGKFALPPSAAKTS